MNGDCGGINLMELGLKEEEGWKRWPHKMVGLSDKNSVLVSLGRSMNFCDFCPLTPCVHAYMFRRIAQEKSVGYTFIHLLILIKVNNLLKMV